MKKEFEVKSVGFRKDFSGKTFYWINWADGSMSYEPKENLTHCDKLITEHNTLMKGRKRVRNPETKRMQNLRRRLKKEIKSLEREGKVQEAQKKREELKLVNATKDCYPYDITDKHIEQMREGALKTRMKYKRGIRYVLTG